MAWVALGEPNLLTLGGRRATMVAVFDEDFTYDIWTFGYKKQSYDFLVGSSSSLTAQLLAGGEE
jgi:hypothetical protein